MLWGALFINAETFDNEIALIQAIAHESAHSLLFGMTVDEPLILNPDQEKFSSPLRDDLRPMDGIYHATFVTARMHWAMNQLLLSRGLSTEEESLVENYLAFNVKNFFSGYQTVCEHAKLTPTGEVIMQNAYQYISTCSNQK